MKKSGESSYGGIDFFRIIAALLVITVHTSPLEDVSGIADFLLTRVIARTAVPFFFMTSGFFILDNAKKAVRAIKNLLVIYFISTVIYIPINIYSGYFKQENLFFNILKDIIFDGTFYHLWYLPAAILGILISFWLVKNLGFKGAIAATAFLYAVGLFGDSYFGAVSSVDSLNVFYKALFSASDYTRNGIFLAPIFITLGAYIRKREKAISAPVCISVGSLFALLMIAEGLILRYYDLQRHDSMYIFLPFLMFFLFSFLLLSKRKRSAAAHSISLCLYIIHPMMIVVTRLCAKITHAEKYLIDNGLIHFGAVLLLSFIASVMLICFKMWRKKHLK